MKQVDAKQKWDETYAKQKLDKPHAAHVVVKFSHLLPTIGSALDLASGHGGNAIFFAQHGLEAHAWDISTQAIKQLDAYCNANDLPVSTQVRDIVANPVQNNSFDVISVSFYLERSITQSIVDALKPNGLLYYQTFVHEKVSDHGPRNPSFRLQANELLKMFSSLHIIAYQEEGCVGDKDQGLRDVAFIVAQKRKKIAT